MRAYNANMGSLKKRTNMSFVILANFNLFTFDRFVNWLNFRFSIVRALNWTFNVPSLSATVIFLDSFDPQLVDSRFFLSSNPLRKIITVVVVVVVAAVIMVIITRKIKSNLFQTLWWKSRPVSPKKEKLNCQIFIFHAFQKAKSNFLKTRQSCQRITLKLKRRKCLLPLFSYLVGPASSRRNRLQDSIEMLKTTWYWKAKKNWGMNVGWFSKTPTDLQ